MGWDAFSSAKYNYETGIFEDPSIGKLFKEASDFVKSLTGSVDGSLDHGVLDVSTCGEMLERGTGENCWTEDPWDKETVKRLAMTANWNFEYDIADAWAYWSAKKFLEICAEAGLSIRFSF